MVRANFLYVMFSWIFFPLITRPTRITSHKALPIDIFRMTRLASALVVSYDIYFMILLIIF